MKLNLSRIHALCFDVDGTLSDTDDQFVLSLARWLRLLGFLLTEQKALALARRIVMATETPGNWIFGLVDRLGVDDELANLGNFIYRLGLGKEPDPFLIIPGVKEMLGEIHLKYALSIVSARDQRTTLRFLEQFGLTSYFQQIVTAHTCSHTKPYPDPILWAAEQMGVAPESCLVIGDTTVDILSGKAAGAQTVGVLCGFGEEAELCKAGADMILPTTTDLLKILMRV